MKARGDNTFKEDKVSIIVPVYNVEQYLKQCVDSVIYQTYTNLEILLIDDGSTDKSGEICDSLALEDNRIKVIHKKNEGLVRARQVGLECSTGEYVLPLDSDDWIDLDTVNDMYRVISEENVDIVLGGLYREYDDHTDQVLDWPEEGRYDLQDENSIIYKRFFINEDKKSEVGIRPNICSRMYRKNILQEAQKKVDTRIKNGEDDACFFPCLLNSKSIYVIHRAYYHYRQRMGSMARNRDNWDMLQSYLLGTRLLESVYDHVLAQRLKEQVHIYVYNRTKQDTFMMGFSSLNRIYQVPYEIIKKGSRIVLYGAGNVGKSYFNQLIYSEYCDLEAWIDKKGIQNKLVLAGEVSIISDIEYDQILIATSSEETATDMKNSLLQYKVDVNKIVWKKPRILKEEVY